MNHKYRIAILGIGGVGGFLGGMLASAYSNTEDIEIIYIARGNHAQAIKENGLKLITASQEKIVHPDVITDDPASIGTIDLLICCVKAYDLESSIRPLLSCVTPDTVILPLLNGVDNSEKLQLMLPEAKVLQGCIYVVSKIIAPGVVQQRGEFWSLHFGGDNLSNTEKIHILELFKKAGINALLESSIHEKMWAKFSFISPIATYTSAYNISIGKILDSEEHKESLKELMRELEALASTLKITLPADSIEKNFLVMEKLPYEATSSMQADFANDKPTELETLTGFVVRKATEQGVELNAYSRIYHLLRERK